MLAIQEVRSAAAEPTGALVDPEFEQWKDGKPAAWRLETGRTSGGGPASSVERGAEGGVALAGTAATKTWWMLAQTVAVEAGRSYRLRFEARGLGLRLEEGQAPNAYVGVVARAGPRLDLSTLRAEMTFRDRWTPCEAVFRASGAEADVVAFLSMTGRLEVRGLRWEALETGASFDVLVDAMDRSYSFFRERLHEPDVEFRKHASAFRERATKAPDLAGFAAVAGEMLAAFHDPHIWIRLPGGQQTVPGAGPVDAGFDAKATALRLVSPRQVGNFALTGIAADGVGYVAIGSMPSDPAGAAALVAAVEEHTVRKAIVLDLRPNGGGFEPTGQVIASLLADQRRVYARRRFRSGPGHDDFGPWIDAEIAPREGRRFAGPVVVILGPACGSSGEGLAAMLAVLPTVTTIGRPTRGASGSPAPVDLPNGASVWFPRWQSALPDGTLLEGHGVAPTVRIDETGSGDPAFQRAVEIALDAVRAKDGKPGR